MDNAANRQLPLEDPVDERSDGEEGQDMVGEDSQEEGLSTSSSCK